MKEERRDKISKVGTNGFFQVLKVDRKSMVNSDARKSLVMVPPDAFNVSAYIIDSGFELFPLVDS